MANFDLLIDSYIIPYRITELENCNSFECGDSDLDDFFKKDVFLYENELLGKSYCWIDKKNTKELIAIATLSYNGINIGRLDKSSRNTFQRIIPNSKRHNSYPAVLIGRLGVNKKYQGKGLNIGSQILDFFKLWFIDNSNKAACRFIIVDAYNNDGTLNFYERNGFRYLFKTESNEKDSFGIPDNINLKSRILFFDLKLL